MSPAAVAPGLLIGERYRLERKLGGPAATGLGTLWLARDQLAADAPAALRQVGPEEDQTRARQVWARLQPLLHPQLPRFGAVIPEVDQLWLVREWQVGRTYRELLEARRDRQLVFGCGEVLLLLRQLLPVLAVLHGQELLHGDLCPANLLRRDSDGLPVLLDFGLVRGTISGRRPEMVGATPGYAPPGLARGEAAEPWMDLHALAVVALVLLSGDEPADLLDPVTLEWRMPAALGEEPALEKTLLRMLSQKPSSRFPGASEALAAFQVLEMPDSTGPVPRADRTVVLVPPEVSEEEAADQAEMDSGPDGGVAKQAQVVEIPASEKPPPPGPVTLPPEPAVPSAARRRYEEREAAAEGGLWPVLMALVISAVAGTALGWWWLSRDREEPPPTEPVVEIPSSLPPAEVDQRQLLVNRLRAMQVDRTWFIALVNASLLSQYPERNGRLPGDTLEDAPLRRAWNDLADEWLAKVEQLPMKIRRRLGSFNKADWERRRADLVAQGLSPAVLNQLVSGNAGDLLPARLRTSRPEEPFRQLWYAVAEQTLENVSIEPINLSPATSRTVSAYVDAGGARLFPIRLPPGHGLAMAVNGTPLLQMSVFAADGRELEPRGPLRVVNLEPQASSPIQLLVSNDGVSAAEIRLQLRADPPPPEPEPIPESSEEPGPGGRVSSPQPGLSPLSIPPVVPPVRQQPTLPTERSGQGPSRDPEAQPAGEPAGSGDGDPPDPPVDASSDAAAP